MTLTWVSPIFEGGCPVRSYSIYRDDGNGGDFVSVDPAIINNLPALRQHTVTFDAADTAKNFRIYLQADNIIGSV
jgi:hypothetical protein